MKRYIAGPLKKWPFYTLNIARIANTVQVFSVWLFECTLQRLKEYNDFNDVTMAYEDGTQVRQTRSSCQCQLFQIKVWVLFWVRLGGEVQY